MPTVLNNGNLLTNLTIQEVLKYRHCLTCFCCRHTHPWFQLCTSTSKVTYFMNCKSQTQSTFNSYLCGTVWVSGSIPKFSWKIVGIYKAPNEDMRVIEILAAWIGYMVSSTKCRIIGGNLNLCYADWNGNTECTIRNQASSNRLVRENGYSLVVDSPTCSDALLDGGLVWPESSFTSCSIIQGISDHSSILLEVELEENCCEPQVER
jgi:hypothetical protein